MASGLYGTAIRGLRRITEHTVDEEPRWRKRGSELLTGHRPGWK
jgi:hydrogenase small subunit